MINSAKDCVNIGSDTNNATIKKNIPAKEWLSMRKIILAQIRALERGPRP